MNRLLLAVLAFLCIGSDMTYAQRLQQPLGRGVVATTGDSQNVLVSWRQLVNDPQGCKYNLYQRAVGSETYTLVNKEPLTVTNYKASLNKLPYDTEFAVTTVQGDWESPKSAPFLFRKHSYGNVYFEFDFETELLNRDNYHVKYTWPMDLDGDGEFDAVAVDRLYRGGSTPDPKCTTTTHKIQGYRLDGTCLWTIDMGPNIDICAGQNDMVTVYDINCDGRCEVLIKSSDGTRFWDAENNTWGKYAMGSDSPDTDGDGISDYTKQSKRNPPFYVSVVDGLTGAEIECSELQYELVTDGVDTYSRSNRSDYMSDGNGTEYAFMAGKFAICYFDGVHPSLAMECLDRRASDRVHHNYVFVWSYDWAGGHPANWHNSYVWSRNDKTPWPAEFHQLRVADTDGDGIDEMLEGGYGVNPVRGMVYSAGIGHGDRYDVGDLDPTHPGMEVYAIQQSNLLGQVLYDASTGEHLQEWYLPEVYDVARGRCIDVDPKHLGYEIFSVIPNLYDCTGELIAAGDTPTPCEAIWWDGTLQRELMQSTGGGYFPNAYIMKYDGTRLIQFSRDSDWAVHADGTAVRPGFFGDIAGDWREEVILMKQNAETSTGLVGYTTDYETRYVIPCLLQDPHYRLDCTTRGYYQMPCTSYYLGQDMLCPPLPPVMTADARWANGGYTTFDQKSTITPGAGNSVIYDISGNNAATVDLGVLNNPAAVFIINPKGHDYTFGGDIKGNGEVWKSQLGTATINGNILTSGTTYVSEGTLNVNGDINGPVRLLANGTLGGNANVKGGITFEGALNYQGCRMMPSGPDGVITIDGNMNLPGNTYLEFDANEGRCGVIRVNGDINVIGTNTITINQQDIAAGEYTLMKFTGDINMKQGAQFVTRGMTGINHTLRIDDNALVLVVNATRGPAINVKWTGDESDVWDYKSLNFELNGEPTYFVAGDKVVIGSSAANANIKVNDMIMASSITIDVPQGECTFTGTGGFSGDCTITKVGDGLARMNLSNSDYTGATIVRGGTLAVSHIADAGQKSSLGAASADEGNLQLIGATLQVESVNAATNRIITVSDTACINITKVNGSMALKGVVKGDGYLTKDGPGQLNFCYPGVNPFAGLIVKQGIVAQGEWNTTFGANKSPMTLAGGEVHLLIINNSSTRPIFDYKATVVEGTSNVVEGTTRGAINGSFSGSGELTILSDGVRNDIGANFAAFNGKLIAKGANFRLMDNVTDMRGTSLQIMNGCNIGHYTSNGSATRAITTRIGSVNANGSSGVLGNGSDSYIVGFDNTDALYRGNINAVEVTKNGTGSWTVSGSAGKTKITVNNGTLILDNNANNPYTTAMTTVNKQAVLRGTGSISSLTLQPGSILAAGTDDKVGTMTIKGKLTGLSGRVECRVTAKGNDCFRIADDYSHNNDTVMVIVDEKAPLVEGQPIKIFDMTGGKMTGTYAFRAVTPGRNVEWDTSTLFTDGCVVPTSVADGIDTIIADNEPVDVYTLDGILIRQQVDPTQALQGLAPGYYIVGGRKVCKIH